MTATGRFAPSPTGPLHLGNLRTALVAWLFARSARGRFLLRIEDLDPDRSSPDWEGAQIDDLRALGLDWDEPPMRQSERGPAYDDALARLHSQGRLYPCFCSRSEIRAAASAPHGDMPEGAYPGTCRRLSARERRDLIESGRRFALRIRADGERFSFEDRILGARSAVVDDFVIVRADGVPSYQLAVVVDDAAQAVTEVVRGADLADSTARQMLLQQLLELPTPTYAHVPLVLGAEGGRLAKRERGASPEERERPSAETLTWLARTIGLASGRDRVEHTSDLIAVFDPARIPIEPVIVEQ